LNEFQNEWQEFHTSKLVGFKSRWMMGGFEQWSQFIPCATSFAHFNFCNNEISMLEWRMSYKLPRGNNSVTMAKWLGSVQAPINNTTFGCRRWLTTNTRTNNNNNENVSVSIHSFHSIEFNVEVFLFLFLFLFLSYTRYCFEEGCHLRHNFDFFSKFFHYVRFQILSMQLLDCDLFTSTDSFVHRSKATACYKNTKFIISVNKSTINKRWNCSQTEWRKVNRWDFIHTTWKK
jgi:hypothetical protein